MNCGVPIVAPISVGVEPLPDVGCKTGSGASIAPSLDRFFVDVLVNCPEEDLRRNRLALLASIQQEFTSLADFSEIVVEK